LTTAADWVVKSNNLQYYLWWYQNFGNTFHKDMILRTLKTTVLQSGKDNWWTLYDIGSYINDGQAKTFIVQQLYTWLSDGCDEEKCQKWLLMAHGERREAISVLARLLENDKVDKKFLKKLSYSPLKQTFVQTIRQMIRENERTK